MLTPAPPIRTLSTAVRPHGKVGLPPAHFWSGASAGAGIMFQGTREAAAPRTRISTSLAAHVGQISKLPERRKSRVGAQPCE